MALLRDQRYKDALNNRTSFITVEKTLENLVGLCINNPRLTRLLYYTDAHALALPALTREQTMSLIGTAIKIVPKMEIDPDVKPYIMFQLDKFVPNPGQTTFRQVSLTIDVLCSYDHWALTDFKLRPYAIAGELDSMINNSFISTGTADFVGASQLVLNTYLGGVTLYYNIDTFLDDSTPLKVDSEQLALANSGVVRN